VYERRSGKPPTDGGALAPTAASDEPADVRKPGLARFLRPIPWTARQCLSVRGNVWSGKVIVEMHRDWGGSEEAPRETTVRYCARMSSTFTTHHGHLNGRVARTRPVVCTSQWITGAAANVPKSDFSAKRASWHSGHSHRRTLSCTVRLWRWRLELGRSTEAGAKDDPNEDQGKKMHAGEGSRIVRATVGGEQRSVSPECARAQWRGGR